MSQPEAIAALVLAAGQSSRMGRPKPFLPLGDTTFLGEILDTAGVLALSPVVAVTHHGLMEPLRDAMPGGQVVVNPDPSRGQFSSLVVGITHLLTLPGGPLRGVVFFLVDHPGDLAERTAAVLRAARQCPGAIHIAAHDGQWGHPVYLPRECWPGLLAWDGADGARGFLRSLGDEVRMVETGSQATLRDIDTPGQYRQLGGAP
jgi:molybdenum cofactor cytidylyltransferase